MLRGSARDGLPTLAPEATRVLIRKATEPPTVADQDLTERERVVLNLLVDGRSNPAIAEALMVSRSTVKTHVSHSLERLGVSSRLEAVTLAIRRK